MSLACLTALVAQFYPKDFPDNIFELKCLISAFICFSSVLGLIAYFIEQDYFMFSFFTGEKAGKGEKEKVYLKIKSDFERYQEFYELTIEAFELPSKVKLCEEKSKTSVGIYFSEEGEIDLPALTETVSGLLTALDDRLKQSDKGISNKETKKTQ